MWDSAGSGTLCRTREGMLFKFWTCDFASAHVQARYAPLRWIWDMAWNPGRHAIVVPTGSMIVRRYMSRAMRDCAGSGTWLGTREGMLCSFPL